MQQQKSGTEESGEREVLRCDSSSLHYSKDTREKTAVGTQSEALTQASRPSAQAIAAIQEEMLSFG